MPDAEGLAEFLDMVGDELALVAELDGEVVGSLYAHLIPPRDDARYQNTPEFGTTRLFIDALGTHPDHWRRGVASALVEAAEAWGREHGATLVECDTWPESPVSMPFWRDRLGYAERSVRLQKKL